MNLQKMNHIMDLIETYATVMNTYNIPGAGHAIKAGMIPAILSYLNDESLQEMSTMLTKMIENNSGATK